MADKLTILFDQIAERHGSMHQLFVNRSLSPDQLGELPAEDFQQWLALKTEADALSEQLCQTIKAKVHDSY